MHYAEEVINMTPHIVIVGGGYSGIMAALRLSHRVAKWPDRPQITLVNASGDFVERIRLHQKAAGQTLRRHSIARLLRGRGIDLVIGEVTALHLPEREIEIRQSDVTGRLHFDRLIYALGSTIDTSAVPGIRENAYTLSASGERSTHALREALPAIAARGGRLIVIGGGLTGIEAASELAENYPGLRVKLVTSGDFGAQFSDGGRRYVLKIFRQLGIEVCDRASVERIEVDQVVLHNGEHLASDLCLWAGAFSVPALARSAGLNVNSRGQIIVDPYLRSTSHPEIYAAGDSAAFAIDPGVPIRMACATAMPMGIQAAENIAADLAGRSLRTFSFVYAGQCISLGRRSGLIQLVHRDDSPRQRIISGRIAAWIKELVCRFTIAALRAERRLPISWWLGKGKSIQGSNPEPRYERAG
jgi:NADH dehydrogenase FAD-containing subunit